MQLFPPSTVKLDLKPPPKAAEKSPLQVAAEGKAEAQDRTIAKPKRAPAWWTARATAGEVTPGFTKAEILRAAPEDPRAPDGVLNKVTELLEDLAG